MDPIAVSTDTLEQDICRLCLSTLYELHKLFPGDGMTKPSSSLMLKIRMLAEVMLSPSEEQEARICSCCVHKLEEFHKFRQTCKSSDGQIRKMRASRKRLKQRGEDSDAGEKESADCASNKKQRTEEVTPSAGGIVGDANKKLGGVFDLVEYCEDMLVPGEFRLLFQGFVYQSESLLVWRCELAEWKHCRSELLIEQDFKKFRVHNKHSHGKICKDDDGRVFDKMQPKIRKFLEMIQQQRYPDEIKEELPEDGSKEVAEKEQPQNMPGLKLEEKQPDAAPVPPEQAKAIPFVYTKGSIQIGRKNNRSMITINGFTYYQQSVSKEQIRWRCEVPLCLGLAVTTKDLKQYTLRKAHKHPPNAKTLANGLNMEEVLPVTIVAKSPLVFRKVASLPINKPPNTITVANEKIVKDSSTENPPVVTRTIASPPITVETNPDPDVSLVETPSEASCILPDHRFFRAKDGSYLMHFENHQYKRDFAHSTVGGETLWRCTIPKCGGSLLAFNYMKQLMNGRPHNHEPQDNVSGEPGDQTLPFTSIETENQTSPSTSIEIPASKGSTVVAFFRSPSNVINLMYESFTYRLKAFLPTGHSEWNCTWTKCDGLLLAGTHFKYVTVETRHSHNAPPTVVMHQRWIPTGQAIMELLGKGNHTDEMRRKIAAPMRISTAELNEIISKRTKLGNMRTVKGQEWTRDGITVSIIQTGK